MVNKLKTCRCCLAEVDNSSELYEFSSEFSLNDENEDPQNFVKISDCFSYLTNISINLDVEEDSKICSPCLGDLKFCYVFLKKCENSEEIYNNNSDEGEVSGISVKNEPDLIEYVEEEFIEGYEGLDDDDNSQIGINDIEEIYLDEAPKKYTNIKKLSMPIKKEKIQQEHLDSGVEKLFPCEQCPKSFKNRYQLTLHHRSHSGEKPFTCNICYRAFSMSSNLQKHIDTHSTDKPYECKICSQFFKTQRSLKFHTVCHHQPEIKVKCTMCDKSFVNKSYLKMHMLYHTGQKNYTCTICKSKYYKSSHLKRHVQNVHFKLRLMKCEFCTSDFVRKETYKSHVTTHHRKDLTAEEFEDVLDRIRKFQAPPIDISKYTLEKQIKVDPEQHAEDELTEMEIIEEDSQSAFEDEEISYEEV